MSSATPVPMALARVTLPARYAAEQSRHADHRVCPERLRVEVVVVDAAVQHVDPLRAARRAHVDRIVLDEQVLALDQLDTHLLGEEGVLEIRRVVGARGEHRHLGLLLARRRHATKILQQQIGIVLDRLDRLRGKQLGETAASSSCDSRACTRRPTARAGCLQERSTRPRRRAPRRRRRCARRSRPARPCPASRAGTGRCQARCSAGSTPAFRMACSW